MSAAVRRMASIASSKVTLYTPSLAMESWAAVIALTARIDGIRLGWEINEEEISEYLQGCYVPVNMTLINKSKRVDKGRDLQCKELAQARR